MRRLIAVLMLVLCARAGAAPFAVMLGGERLVVDTVPGFSDVIPLGSPRLHELAESLTSASNRILLFGLTDGDIRKFTQGDRADLRRYMILVTPGHLEHQRVTQEQFKLLIDDAQRDTGKPPAPPDYRIYLDTQPRGLPTAIVALPSTDRIYSVLLGTRLPDQEPTGWAHIWSNKPILPQYVLSSSTLMLLRGKALKLSVYTGYDGPPDVEWIRFVTARWIETLQRLNGR